VRRALLARSLKQNSELARSDLPRIATTEETHNAAGRGT
jgi:hypothetical protein